MKRPAISFGIGIVILWAIGCGTATDSIKGKEALKTVTLHIEGFKKSKSGAT